MAYDNTNRGSLWATKGAHGPVDIEGDGLHGYLIATPGPNEKAPDAIVFIRRGQEEDCKCYPVWRSEANEYNQLYHGQTPTHWLNVYKGKPGAERAPDLSVQLRPKEPKQPTQAAPPPAGPDVGDGEDIPF